jgi:aryl-alcohol dehydrogenase-like predicted oxidoreductase
MTDWELGKVRLGTDGPAVGRQGFGAMAINTGYYGPTDEAAARATLEQALAVGITLFDTADAYGDGANEQFLAPPPMPACAGWGSTTSTCTTCTAAT